MITNTYSKPGVRYPCTVTDSIRDSQILFPAVQGHCCTFAVISQDADRFDAYYSHTDQQRKTVSGQGSDLLLKKTQMPTSLQSTHRRERLAGGVEVRIGHHRSQGHIGTKQ